MTTTVELIGKCRELGYCDCGGANGCVDDEAPRDYLLSDDERKARMAGAKSTMDYRNHNMTDEATVERVAGSRRKRVTYAYCPKCKGGLFAGREHHCKAEGKVKELWCEECQAYYTGKPTTHRQEVHNAAAIDDTRTNWNGQLFENSNQNKKEAATMPPAVTISTPLNNCGYCRKRGAPCVKHGGERSGVYTPKKKKIIDALKGENDAKFDIPAGGSDVLSDRVSPDPIERVRETRVDSAADTERVAEQNLRRAERQMASRDDGGDKEPAENPQGLDPIGISQTEQPLGGGPEPQPSRRSIELPREGGQLELALQFSGVSITIKIGGTK